MEFKEEAIIRLNEVIYSKKSKLSKKDRETLIVIREEIRRAKTETGFLKILKKLKRFVGFFLDDDDD